MGFLLLSKLVAKPFLSSAKHGVAQENFKWAATKMLLHTYNLYLYNLHAL